MKKITLLMLSILFVVCFAWAIADAATVTLTWNASNQAEGYRAYYGTASGVYRQAKNAGLDVGNKLTHSFQFLQENDDVRYYFAVTAYNKYGESDYSEEASVTITGKHDTPERTLMTRITVVYENGDTVDFDLANRTTITTKADGVVVKGGF